MNNNSQVYFLITLLKFNSVNYKGVIKKFALYIPRLLTGKLENICAAIPLATFWTKILKEYLYNFCRPTKYQHIPP